MTRDPRLDGALLALVVARVATALLVAWHPPLPFSLGLDVGVDLRVVAFTGGVTLLAAIAFGLLPARWALRSDVADALRSGGRSSEGAGRMIGSRNTLVVAQVAVSLVFLVAAALLGQGLLTAGRIDPGFDTGRVAALGLHLGMHGYEGEEAEVFLRTLSEAPRPLVHFSRAQAPVPHGYLLAHAAGGSGGALIAELRGLALAMDPGLAFSETKTLADFMGVSLYPVRMATALLGAFGALALTLAALGLYGVIAYRVSRQRRDMAIRLALGARRGEVVGLVLRRGMALVGVGTVVGLALAVAGAQLLSGLLYGASPFDPLAFGGAVAVLALAALAANLIPAVRAGRVAPAAVLREE